MGADLHDSHPPCGTGNTCSTPTPRRVTFAWHVDHGAWDEDEVGPEPRIQRGEGLKRHVVLRRNVAHVLPELNQLLLGARGVCGWGWGDRRRGREEDVGRHMSR